MGGGGIQKVNEDAAAKLAQLLDDEQEKRLRGITIQILGANAVMADAGLASELKVSDQQKFKLQEIQQSNMREMSDTFRVSAFLMKVIVLSSKSFVRMVKRNYSMCLRASSRNNSTRSKARK